MSSLYYPPPPGSCTPPSNAAAGGNPAAHHHHQQQLHHHLEVELNKQINTLQIFNENVSSLDKKTFRIPIHPNDSSRSAQDPALIVHLPQGFISDPQIPPFIRYDPSPVSHPWIDPHEGSRIIGAPGLRTWNARLMDLGRVVQAIKREFQLNPPTLHYNSSSHPFSFHPSSGYQQYQQHQQNTISGSDSAASSSSSSNVLYGLEALNLEELKELEKDPSALNRYLHEKVIPKDSMINRLEVDKERLKESLESEFGRCQETRDLIDRLKEESLSTKQNQIQELVETLENKKIRAEELNSELKCKNENQVCDRLAKLSAQDEEKSDEIAESFLNGNNANVEDFLKSYLDLRKSHHLNKWKSEQFKKDVNYQPDRKLQEALNRLHSRRF